MWTITEIIATILVLALVGLLVYMVGKEVPAAHKQRVLDKRSGVDIK